MDFSGAEYNGFINAFVTFWQYNWPDPEQRTEEQLRQAAKLLLRGCKWHFRENAMRISRIEWVVPPHLRNIYIGRIDELLECDNHELFIKQCGALLQLVPDIQPWLVWYLRPAHARMLFAAKREMEIEVWDSLPDTTNAEEAMHWKMYAGTGRDHDFLEGLEALWAFGRYYKRIQKMVESE